MTPMPVHPLTERVAAFITTAERLTAIVRRETAELKARRPAALRETLEEKTRLSGIYMREIAALRAEKALLRQLPKALAARLEEAMRALNAALAEHQSLLQRIRSVTEGLVRAVAEEMAATRRTVTSYGRDAMTRAYAGSQHGFTLNQKA